MRTIDHVVFTIRLEPNKPRRLYAGDLGLSKIGTEQPLLPLEMI